jgi:hypothetical protein
LAQFLASGSVAQGTNFALAVRGKAASATQLYPRSQRTENWESGRVVQYAEVWQASRTAITHPLSIPIGLGPMACDNDATPPGWATPCALVSLAVEPQADTSLVVSDPHGVCSQTPVKQPELSALEREDETRDRNLIRTICSARGTWRLQGSTYRHVP